MNFKKTKRIWASYKHLWWNVVKVHFCIYWTKVQIWLIKLWHNDGKVKVTINEWINNNNNNSECKTAKIITNYSTFK